MCQFKHLLNEEQGEKICCGVARKASNQKKLLEYTNYRERVSTDFFIYE
jgi:hypothetical protein